MTILDDDDLKYGDYRAGKYKPDDDNIYRVSGGKKDYTHKLIRPSELTILSGAECVVDDLIGVNDMALMRAEPNGGKTALAAHLGLCIATGVPFAGRRVQGPVVYCVGEGNRGFRKRIAATFKRLVIKQDNSIPFFVLDEMPDLCPQQRWTTLGGIASHLAQDISEQIGRNPVLAIFDTLSKAMPFGDDGKPEDMKTVLGNLHTLRRTWQCATLLLHHPGWANAGRIRGWSGTLGDIDTEIEIRGERREVRTVTITKSRDLECVGWTMRFLITAEPVTGLDGQQLNAAAVEVFDEWNDGGDIPRGRQKARRKPKGVYPPQVLSSIHDALLEHGEPPPRALQLPAVLKVVCKQHVVEQAKRRAMGQKDDHSFRSRFSDALSSLTGSGHIQVLTDDNHETWIWLVEEN